MWTADPSEFWLNTPDVRTTDDVDDPACTAPASDPDGLLTDFNVDVEEELVTAPDLTCKSAPPDVEWTLTDSSVPDLGVNRLNGEGQAASTTLSASLTGTAAGHEQFIVIQVPFNSELAANVLSMLSRVTNNNECVVDNSSLSANDHRDQHHHRNYDDAQQQQQQQAQTTSADLTPNTGAADVGYQLSTSTSGAGETGNDVMRFSEEDLARMLDDAEAIMSIECRQQQPDPTTSNNPLVDMPTSGMWMTSSDDVEKLSASNVSTVCTNQQTNASRDHTPNVANGKKKADRNRKQRSDAVNCGSVSRLERRREQNRRAARGSRERKRQKSTGVIKEYQRELSLNTALNYEMRQLKQQQTSLLKLLVDHLADCPSPASALALLTSISKTAASTSTIPAGPVLSTSALDSVQR